jgi:hypothetical protein
MDMDEDTMRMLFEAFCTGRLEVLEQMIRPSAFSNERDARDAAHSVSRKRRYDILNEVMVHNGTGHDLRLRALDSWEGEFRHVAPARLLRPGQWTAVVHDSSGDGSEGCLIYEVLGDDGKPTHDVFLGFSSLRGLSKQNRVYVEVREPGHWWTVGSKDHMGYLTRTKGKYDVSDGQAIRATGHIPGRGDYHPDTIFKITG